MRHAVLAAPMKLVSLALGSSIAVLVAATPATAQCADAYEPDNSALSTSALIVDGETQHRNFCDNAFDWVGFVACTGETYTIETSNLDEAADTFLELFGPDGNALIDSNDDYVNGGGASRIVWTATSSAIFHVKIHQANFSYGLYRGYDLHLDGRTTKCDLWTYKTGGAEWDETTALVQRPDGVILAAGSSRSFTPSSPLLWFVNVDMSGVTQGQRASYPYYTINGASHAATRNSQGQVVIVGEGSSYLTQGLDSVVINYGLDGSNPIQLQVGGPGDDYSNAIAILGDGSYAIAGSTGSAAEGFDGWVYRIPVGYGSAPLWQKALGGSGNEELYSVVGNSNGDITVAGYTTSGGAGGKDGLIARFDASGSLLWSRAIGGTGDDEFRKVFETPDGGLLLFGTSTGSTFVVAANAWLVKLDGNGQLRWGKTIGAGGDDRLLGALAVTDGYILAGYSDSVTSGNYDGLLLKVDAEGNPIWTRTFGGLGIDRLYDVIQSVDGTLVATGFTKSLGWGLADAWILKIARDGASSGPCQSTTPPQMTVQSRTDAELSLSLSGLPLSVQTYYNQYPLYPIGSQGGLQCHISSPVEVSGPLRANPLIFTSRVDLVWEDPAVNHADVFNLYRGDIVGLPVGDSGSCLGTIQTNAYTDLDEPAYGGGWFYLVTGRNALGEGSMGTNSAGVPRANTNPCP